MPNPDRIIAELRRRRRGAGISQNVIAELVGCSRRAVSMWENGRSRPIVDDVEAYARALGRRLALVKALVADTVDDGAAITAQLDRLRRTIGISCGAAAEQIGCDRSAVWMWGNGCARPRLDHAEAYARALGRRLVLVDAKEARR